MRGDDGSDDIVLLRISSVECYYIRYKRKVIVLGRFFAPVLTEPY